MKKQITKRKPKFVEKTSVEKLAIELFNIGIKAAERKRPDIKMVGWQGLQAHIKAGHLAVGKYVFKKLLK